MGSHIGGVKGGVKGGGKAVALKGEKLRLLQSGASAGAGAEADAIDLDNLSAADECKLPKPLREVLHYVRSNGATTKK